jgi:TatD DNase family protein
MPMWRLVDTHAHMESMDAELIRSDALAAGVDAVVCVGGDLESSIKSLELAQGFPDFYYPAIGVHPYNFLKVDADAAERFLAENIGLCVAMGEVGLDYAYDFARSNDVRLRMKEVFRSFLRVADEAGKPVSVHSRSAYLDAFELVEASGVCEAVFHWFDGPLHVLRKILDAGFFISVSAALGYSRGVRTVIAEAPLEWILVETDSPVFLRDLNRLSVPADVVGVVEALAELKGLDFDEVARVTTANAVRFFGL